MGWRVISGVLMVWLSLAGAPAAPSPDAAPKRDASAPMEAPLAHREKPPYKLTETLLCLEPFCNTYAVFVPAGGRCAHGGNHGLALNHPRRGGAGCVAGERALGSMALTLAVMMLVQYAMTALIGTVGTLIMAVGMVVGYAVMLSHMSLAVGGGTATSGSLSRPNSVLAWELVHPHQHGRGIGLGCVVFGRGGGRGFFVLCRGGHF